VVSLLRKVGARRRALGAITELVRHPDNRVLKVAIKLQDRWPGHDAGQFAFVTFDPDEGAHPFTISSAWQGDGRMFFLIKGIGDYTGQLPGTLQVGQPVTVEGPYGRFGFAGDKTRQIWVAGGIGITPSSPACRPWRWRPTASGGPFYSTSAPDAVFINKVRQRAEDAGVVLHVLVSQRDGRLDARRIAAAVPDWKAADFWFCGPAASAARCGRLHRPGPPGGRLPPGALRHALRPAPLSRKRRAAQSFLAPHGGGCLAQRAAQAAALAAGEPRGWAR
jgi:predicted ferric reductase